MASVNSLTNITKENSASDQAWELLQQYLERYEDQKGHYRRCTTNFTLPTWLVNSYKSLNSAELLRLYIDYDLLEEAANLCLEYIDAVQNTFEGHDSEAFQLKGCIQPLPLTVWLPYTSIDQLLRALQDRKDSLLSGLYQTLRDKLTKYLGKLQ